MTASVLRLFLILAILLMSMSMSALAQDGPPPLPEGAEVVAEGLNYPRLLTVGEDGTIYVAIVGAGGDVIVTTPEGDVPFGYSSEVIAIAADGSQSTLVGNLPSAAGIGGATAIEWGENSYWVGVSGPGPEAPPNGLLAASALQFSAEDNHLLTYVDLYGYEVANDPDGNGVDTNTGDILVASDGTVYILDVGANTLFTWTADGGLEPLVIWEDNSVPTAVAEAPDGNLVISHLGAELAPGAGKVEVISTEGEVLETYAGFNTLTDVVVADDGAIYAVALISGFGEQGPLPGQVIHVNAGEGGEIVVDGLMVPYGIALEADGSMLVTTGASFVPPGMGMVLRFPPHAD